MFAFKAGKIAVLSLGLAAVSAVFAEPAFTMRIDDNHSEKDWTRVADIFEKHGILVSFAVVPAALSESQGKCLKQLADRGHELMDHMPNHAFYRAKYHDRAAFEKVKSKPFVQEADEKEMRVLFKCEVDPNHPKNRSVRASVKGNVLTFADNSVNKTVSSLFLGLPGKKGLYGLKRNGDAFELYEIGRAHV